MDKRMLKSAMAVLLAAAGNIAFASHFEELLSLESLHDARIITEQRQETVEKIYPKGSVRRISGNTRYSGEVLVRGSVDVLTVQLSPSHEALSAFNGSRQLLQGKGADMLYWCAARECGPSNLWANHVFNNARLYGPDDQQAYALYRLKEGEQSNLVAVYAITRGNGRGFLHAEYFQAQQLPERLLPTATTLERQLSTDDRLALRGLTGEPDSVWVHLLVRALNQNSTMRISMAGEYATQWRDAMVEVGLRKSRIEIEAEFEQPGLLLQRLP
ncbi:DUF4892 domain-containing protein [Denitrificimonas sp. JX-1]|uniref:DUF4892 domain-containing protein n=1 Tax=Denitrificimonas halotolerans TaxID=3098930 RepID=A0ABU5GS37_9GAMM|nr:DUF4892 domain-containing protein [Denitrificimonas sp. JX-1]MDY7219604.1 DUF4892 domain-containing protein [Denitrificimonas sp. JX-1]